MPYVYIIQDKITGRYYTGSCLELSKRITRHTNHTGGKTTRKGEWSLVCYKALDTISEARLEEKKVKSYKGGNAFKKIISGDVSEWSNVPPC
jgi:putative endonuclease